MPYIEGESSLLIYRTLEGDPQTSASNATIPGAHTFYDGESQIGSLQLECIQPGSGSFISDYLESKGEGINHLCFNVPDVDAATEKLLAKGCDLMFSAKTGGQIIENYLDTRKFGDVIISFRPPAGEWEKAWKENNLAHPLVSDWEFRGVGVAVNDLDLTAEYYQYLGFEVQSEARLNSSACSEFRLGDGYPDSTVEARSRMVEIGPLLYEFVQPVTGEAVFQESLQRRDEGINSIDFTVQDLDEETAKLVERGVPMLMSGKPATSDAFAYFDTREVGNIMVKLVQATNK